MAKATQRSVYDYLKERPLRVVSAETLRTHFGYSDTGQIIVLLNHLQKKGAIQVQQHRPRRVRVISPLPYGVYESLSGKSEPRKEEPEMEQPKTRIDLGAGSISKVVADTAAKLKKDVQDELKDIKKSHKKIDDAVGTIVGLVQNLESVKNELASVKASKLPRTLIIKHIDRKPIELNEHRHKAFDRILQLVAARKNILLTGPTGCGKSWVAEQVARALKLRFGSISCTEGMSEAQLLGGMKIEKGDTGHRGTACLECYENGGVFLWDEFDAGDANVTLVVNSMTDRSKSIPVPFREDKPRAIKHQDFVPIATANTLCIGGNREYVGRNQLDKALLNRFHVGIVEMDYDRILEKRIVTERLNSKGKDLLQLGESVRAAIQELRLIGKVWSTRFYEDAADMMAFDMSRWTLRQVFDQFTVDWNDNEKAKVKHLRPAAA